MRDEYCTKQAQREMLRVRSACHSLYGVGGLVWSGSDDRHRMLVLGTQQWPEHKILYAGRIAKGGGTVSPCVSAFLVSFNTWYMACFSAAAARAV